MTNTHEQLESSVITPDQAELITINEEVDRQFEAKLIEMQETHERQAAELRLQQQAEQLKLQQQAEQLKLQQQAEAQKLEEEKAARRQEILENRRHPELPTIAEVRAKGPVTPEDIAKESRSATSGHANALRNPAKVTLGVRGGVFAGGAPRTEEKPIRR